MRKFEVGDRVRFIGDLRYLRGPQLNALGTIIFFRRRDSIYGVEFDDPVDGGHNCDGKAKKGRGWNFKERYSYPGKLSNLQLAYTWKKL